MTIELRPIYVSDLRGCEAMFAEHWAEVARNKDVMQLEPDWPYYEGLELNRRLHAIGAFDGPSLVGYSVNILTPRHPHYAGLAILSNDLLFVTRSARKAGVGLALIGATEQLFEQLHRDRGVRMLTWHAKESTELEALLRRRGYAVQDVLFSRVRA